MQIKGDQNENFWWVKGSIVNSNLIEQSQCTEKRKIEIEYKHLVSLEG